MILDLIKKAKRSVLGTNNSRDFLLKTMPQGSVCAEIGVYKGDFSKDILRTVKPSRLHLIDPWKYMQEYEDALYGGKAGSQDIMEAIFNNVKRRFDIDILRGSVVINRGLSDAVSKSFNNDYFDWVYIDGNHTYEYVKMDLECYYPKVKKGGFIAGDDYISDRWWKDGVNKAVDEFVASGKVKVVMIKNGQFILMKI
ncbi:MAG: class I SAM-dependent methyltransferase [Sporocytophaga sp.]|uniref:class I SAM-dependent methyltransferase n=1 Tax=Sporocytophaga sp. TaxID=2231183 RepID=UPI001B26F552|nr:class I SAM-dependent methyltransferase [Sporocytophaga sp.]MBO9699274.1 class I SAM-dependent methyltransferase [Sporocytophaga sp.]